MFGLIVVGCCGAGSTHKCDFAPPDELGFDGGTDGPVPCGTEICEGGKVCCATKAPALLQCIDPAKFRELHCETMPLPCLKTSDCPGGLSCCVVLTDDGSGTVSCLPPLQCLATGAVVCADSAECPDARPVCRLLTTTPEGDFNICE